MTGQDIRDAGGLYFEKITEGFEQYNYKIRQMNNQQALFFLQELWKKNGRSAAFTDFYYTRLDELATQRIHQALTTTEIAHLQRLKMETNALFVPLTEELLKIYLKLNEKEILFSTFYFTTYPCTVWGNYNQEYIIFKKH